MFPLSSYTECVSILTASCTYLFLSMAVRIKLVITLMGDYQVLSDSVAFLIFIVSVCILLPKVT